MKESRDEKSSTTLYDDDFTDMEEEFYQISNTEPEDIIVNKIDSHMPMNTDREPFVLEDVTSRSAFFHTNRPL